MFRQRSANFEQSNIYIPLSIPAGTRIAARVQANGSFRVIDIIATFIGTSFLPSMPNDRTETFGADTTNTKGIQIDAGGVANTKGVYAEIIASTAFDVNELVLCIGNNNNFALAVCSFLIDIAIGTSGSEEVIVSNLLFTSDDTSDMIYPMYTGPIPIQIPAGSRIAVRSQCSIINIADRKMDVSMIGFG